MDELGKPASKQRLKRRAARASCVFKSMWSLVLHFAFLFSSWKFVVRVKPDVKLSVPISFDNAKNSLAQVVRHFELASVLLG